MVAESLSTVVGIIIYILLSITISQGFYFLKYYQARFVSLLTLCLLSFLISFAFPFKTVFLVLISVFLVFSLTRMYKKKAFFFDRTSEMSFLIPFGFFIFLRLLIPDIFGAEKLMDIAFLNSILNARSFPPLDPFLAGSSLNFYYYFGYVLGGAITLMSFTEPEVGYNIAMSSISSFSFMIAFGFFKEVLIKREAEINNIEKIDEPKNLSRNAVAGTLFVLVSGNFYAIYDFFQNLLKMKLPEFLFYWDATRVIEGTINEFPYFSFIHADFHAHVVAIPIKLLFISLLYSFYKEDEMSSTHTQVAITSVLIIAIVFILFATNSWDAPLSVFLLGLVTLLKHMRGPFNKKMAFYHGLILFSSVLPVIILSSTMDLQAAKISIVQEKSGLIEFLAFFSIQILFAYAYLFEGVRKVIPRNQLDTEGTDKYFINKENLLLVAIPGVLSFYYIPIGLIIVPLLLLSIPKIKKGDFFAILIFTGSLLITAAEITSIDSRLNTVFKFYLSAWILLTIPGAIRLVSAFKEPKKAVNIILIFIFVLSFVYPLNATPLRHYKAEFTLNGMKFVKYSSEGDYEAIEWLKENELEGNIVEEALKCYNYGGRFSAFTGIPTIIAWPGHEVQWRGNGEELGRRMAEVRLIYTSQNCSMIKSILEKYNVRYIMVGYQEYKEYGVYPNKFRKCGFEEVFKSETASKLISEPNKTYIYKFEREIKELNRPILQN